MLLKRQQEREKKANGPNVECFVNPTDHQAVSEPVELKGTKGTMVISEIELYEDTIIRFVQTSEDYEGVFFPGYQAVTDVPHLDYGIRLIDHVVSNTWDMRKNCDNMIKWLGLHTFAAFTKEVNRTLLPTHFLRTLRLNGPLSTVK